MMLIIILMFTTKSVEPTILTDVEHLHELEASCKPPLSYLHNITRTHSHITQDITIQTCNNITLVSEPNASVLGQTFLLD